MDPYEVALARIAHDLAIAGIQAAAAFNHAQNGLGLERLLDADRLTTEEGVLESRNTLRQLVELMSKHKEMFSNFITGATSQLLTAVSQVPQSQRAKFQERYMHSINWNIECQAKFYEGRERWISAASLALDLAEENAGGIWLDGDQLMFSDESLLNELSALVDVMDGVRDAEIALLQERQAHVAAAISRMESPA